jgi:hypothetical protein
MMHPRFSLLTDLVTSPLVQKPLPTGNGFGGSNLKIDQLSECVFPIVSSSVSFSDCPVPSEIKQSSPLVIEVGKIVLLALWFWCLIGADFCADRIGMIAAFSAQDI